MVSVGCVYFLVCLICSLPLGYWVANGLPEAVMPKCVGSYLRFGSLRIEVHDEGPGITRQGKEMLFREGVQLNPNQLQSGQGM